MGMPYNKRDRYMSEPFIAEIRIFAFDWAPVGWSQCDGQVIPITQNQALYAIIGDTYGGDGRSTFGLPDLRGCVPVNKGAVSPIGVRSGVETVKLNVSELPSHDHSLNAVDADGTTDDPAGAVLAKPSDGSPVYAPSSGSKQIATNPVALSAAGGSGAHNNMQPSMVVNFCIAMSGYFPSRN
jgi:microcystin-dependent protein